MSARRSYPRLRLGLGVALPLGLFFLVRRFDLFGDRGMANVVSALLVVLTLLGWLAWFLVRGGWPARRRLALFLVVLAGAAATGAFVRVRGFSGDMVPVLAWRFAPEDAADVAPGRPAGAADLSTTDARDFPGFLGPERSGRVAGVRLGRDWGARPPRLLWRRPIGAGWSGFAVVNGWAVTMEQGADGEIVGARDLATGEIAWTRAAPGRFFHLLGGDGPRATPAIAGGLVYTLGALGRLACLDGRTGAPLWERDLLADYGVTPAEETARVQYGRSNSPLVAGGRVVVPAGGVPGGRQAGLAAFDAQSGERLWESAPRGISYSSPTLAMLGGVEQLLIVNEDSLAGHDPASGRMLWEHPWPGDTSADANVSQALPVPAERVFVSKGYGGGALLLRLRSRGDGSFATQEVWRDARLLRTKFTNVVLYEGHVYGLDDGILECVELETGRLVWKEGRYGHGQMLLAGELLLLVSEEGEVLCLDPRPDRPDAVLGRFQALEGKCWSPPALYGGVLVLRNAEECAAWELPVEGP